MRVAVILTGALRTIRKTMRYLKEHVVINPYIDIFACVQNDTAQSEEEWSEWFNTELRDSLKKITWFSLEKYADWIPQRERLLSHLTIDAVWKDYLRTSGSMIEYLQLHLAYMDMSHYEQVFKFKYEYVIRTRTDSIFTKPVDFHWLNWSKEEVDQRIHKIRHELRLHNMDESDKNIFKYFMCTILSDDVIPNIYHMFADIQLNETDTIPSLNQFHQYIQNGRYILTLRKNNLYIVKRNLFYLIPSLAMMYGMFRSPCSDDYWFNAEGQFRDACYYSCISVFDYSTFLEETSLDYPSSWDGSKYFDSEFNLIHNNMLYCIVRK